MAAVTVRARGKSIGSAIRVATVQAQRGQRAFAPAGVFLAAVVSFVKGYEEPRLAQQFGESYERYRRAVPGWWPRPTAYRP